MTKAAVNLRTVRVTAAVYWGFISEREPLHLTFQHRADVRTYTSSYDFADSCVFVKQLFPPILCHSLRVAPTRVLLLPKLRSHFAEFLQLSSLTRLSLLDPPTCVGFGYGLASCVFSWRRFPTQPIHSDCIRCTPRHARWLLNL